MPEAQPLRPHDPVRLGRYELLGRLGAGAQGTVFLAEGAGGERVAVKLLQVQFDDDATARARFVREAEAAKQVARFCTAQLLDAEVAGDTPYLVSEYVPGEALNRAVARDGPLAGGALDRLAVSTASALTAIHRAGVVHRDLKPHNVLLGPDGPRVIDFGLSRVLDAASAVSSRAVGTPAYMAPEQVSGGSVGAAADVFGWGATMTFAATGRPPFGSDSIPAVMYRVLHHDPDLGGLDGSWARWSRRRWRRTRRGGRRRRSCCCFSSATTTPSTSPPRPPPRKAARTAARTAARPAARPAARTASWTAFRPSPASCPPSPRRGTRAGATRCRPRPPSPTAAVPAGGAGGARAGGGWATGRSRARRPPSSRPQPGPAGTHCWTGRAAAGPPQAPPTGTG